MHPDLETLIAWCDHELPPAKSGRVARHVYCCAACRAAAEGVRAEREAYLPRNQESPEEASPALEEGLVELLAAARSWQDAAGPRAAVEKRLMAELEACFGAELAALVMNRARENGPGGLFPYAEAFVGAYLGRRNAACLFERIGAGLGRSGEWAAS